MVRGNDRSAEVSTAHLQQHLATYAFQIFQSVELRAQPAVYAQELLVHDSGKRKRAERIHAGFINSLGVFVFAFELEREIIGQMATLVVAA